MDEHERAARQLGEQPAVVDVAAVRDLARPLVAKGLHHGPVRSVPEDGEPPRRPHAAQGLHQEARSLVRGERGHEEQLHRLARGRAGRRREPDRLVVHTLGQHPRARSGQPVHGAVGVAQRWRIEGDRVEAAVGAGQVGHASPGGRQIGRPRDETSGVVPRSIQMAAGEPAAVPLLDHVRAEPGQRVEVGHHPPRGRGPLEVERDRQRAVGDVDGGRDLPDRPGGRLAAGGKVDQRDPVLAQRLRGGLRGGRERAHRHLDAPLLQPAADERQREVAAPAGFQVDLGRDHHHLHARVPFHAGHRPGPSTWRRARMAAHRSGLGFTVDSSLESVMRRPHRPARPPGVVHRRRARDIGPAAARPGCA